MTKWFEQAANLPDTNYRQRAFERQQQLTKPPGSLGVLENCAIELAALQRSDTPRVDNIAIAIFAGDHGVADEGVSAFPQVVTGEMVKNFSAGGAAITVLARELKARFQVVNVGTVNPLPELPSVLDRRIAAGTENFCNAEAMSEAQCLQALQIGADIIEGMGAADVFIGGEMGIANTTTAAAIAAALLKIAPQDIVGRGTGVDDKGVALKADVIARALQKHAAQLHSAFSVLQTLGGFEIAALAGAYIRSAQKGIPVLVDGFICTAAALAAVQLNESIRPWLMFSHCSAERGHRLLIEHLDVRPLLNLDMRLGEGSGAAVAASILRAACALHNGMASFASAGVSQA